MILLLSGNQLGSHSSKMVGVLVRFTGAEPSAFIDQMSQSVIDARMKMIRLPSAENAGSNSVVLAVLVMSDIPEPSAFITNMSGKPPLRVKTIRLPSAETSACDSLDGEGVLVRLTTPDPSTFTLKMSSELGPPPERV